MKAHYLCAQYSEFVFVSFQCRDRIAAIVVKDVQEVEEVIKYRILFDLIPPLNSSGNILFIKMFNNFFLINRLI